MTKGDRWKVRQGWRSLGWAIQPSSGEPDTGEPDARNRARPVREGAVGFPWQQGAGRLPHRLCRAMMIRGFRKLGAGEGTRAGEVDWISVYLAHEDFLRKLRLQSA